MKRIIISSVAIGIVTTFLFLDILDPSMRARWLSLVIFAVFWYGIFGCILYSGIKSRSKKTAEAKCQDCDGTGKITATQYEKKTLETSVPVLQTKYGIDSEGKPFRLDIEVIENDKKDSILENTNRQN